MFDILSKLDDIDILYGMVVRDGVLVLLSFVFFLRSGVGGSVVVND